MAHIVMSTIARTTRGTLGLLPVVVKGPPSNTCMLYTLSDN